MSNVLHDLQILLLNIFFIFTFFFIYLKFIEKKIYQITNKFLIILASGSSIVLCMTFSIHISPGQLIDMRYVPFIVGAFYGGRKVAITLFLILVTYRFSLGGSGFYINLAGSTLLLISLWFMIPFFEKTVNLKKRIRLVIAVSVFSALYTGIALGLFFSEVMGIRTFTTFTLFLCIQITGTILFVNFIERAKKDMAIAAEIGKLEKLKTVSDMAASISHEVRNPLTVTRGFLQLLRDPDLTEKEKSNYIDIAVGELDKAESTISDYLTFARPSLENIKVLDLKKELTYAVKVVEPFAAMNNVCIELQLHADVSVAGESQKLHQCLINLTKNAIEAMPDGGKLVIALQKVNGKAVIIVADTGVGLTDEQIERLGTPYYTTKEKGTGLGTMVIFSIVKAMRGEIEVDSEVGKGTRFTILLPVAEAI
ncbi:sensor histidine kinase [Domibacillus iocasae]|uniref:histidine kinase n=1 Tax=Domibacillus iocasae TaxID=1714016 RepID=A0A1E7DR14_9BACI|nr:sensor histidine kinase [Domibacillus iocasae]OES45504.1 hypothetical protein BA724_01400 [Domibacillus iocasae]